jgi:colicin import membrane protein
LNIHRTPGDVMARKLRSFTTSIGFFDLAVAAPSMKAALEAWGAQRNLFQLGTARETGDPQIVAATMAQPGVVLKRAVGTNTAFKLDAQLPNELPNSAPRPRPARKADPIRNRAKSPIAETGKTHKAAIIQFEKEKARRDKERAAREEEEEKNRAKESREEERRQQAVARAKALFDQARSRHERKLQELDRERAALDRKVETEKERWEREQTVLQKRIRDADR